MPRPKKPIVIQKRKDTKTYLLTLNPTSGLPVRVCREWQRKSFQNFPPELAIHYNPKTKVAAETGALALVSFLKNAGAPVHRGDFLVGDWLRLFTSMAESPKGARNIAENRPYSEQSVDRLKCLYDVHMKADPFMELPMNEVEASDALAFINRMGLRKLEGGRYRNEKNPPRMMGTETFDKLVKFLRMAFKEYGRDRSHWQNAFLSIDPPRNIKHEDRDALPEEEVLKLFLPGVLRDPMEIAVCAAMFLAGLRRSEIFALRSEDLDWYTPKITVRLAWQNFNYQRRVMGPTKSKKERLAPFDLTLQDAIKRLWKVNGEHEFVFSYKDGTTPGPSWIKGRFKKWLARAGIELKGRQIVPHRSRHSLASILEERGVSLRYIQDLLGHSDLKTTKRYLHSTDKTIRDIGSKIDAAMEAPEPEVIQEIPRIRRIG
jgi:integrase/recombinase XerD